MLPPSSGFPELTVPGFNTVLSVVMMNMAIGGGSTNVRGVTLMNGEEVIHNQQPRWRDYPWSLTIGILTCWFGVGFLFFFWIWRRKRRNRLVVTNERVVQSHTTRLSASTNEYPIRDINQLETNGERWSIIGSKTGSIMFSVGGGGERVELSNIRNYDAIANTIREQGRRIAKE